MGRKITLTIVSFLLLISSALAQHVKELQNIGITQIIIIEEALNNDVWVGSLDQGAAFYSGTTHTWSYYNTTNTPQFKSDSITSISFGLIGGVQHAFIGTRNGLVYNHGGPWDTLPSASPSYADRFVTGVSMTGSDTIWASTLNGLISYDTSTLQITRGYTTGNSNVPYDVTNSSQTNGQTCSGFTIGTPDSGVFYTINGGVSFSKIDTSGPDFKLVDNRVNTICVDNNCTRRLIGTKGGFSICPQGMPCQNITTADGLPENDVTSIAEDCAGNIWVGMPDSGVAIFSTNGILIGKINMANGLTNNLVSSISFAGGSCTGYVATGDGNLAVIDTTHQVIQIINGVNDVNASNLDVRVFPQPSGLQVTFLFGSELTDGNIYLTDMSGRSVQSLNIRNTTYVNADVSSLSDGIYLYRIIADGQQPKTGKLEVVR